MGGGDSHSYRGSATEKTLLLECLPRPRLSFLIPEISSLWLIHMTAQYLSMSFYKYVYVNLIQLTATRK